MSILEILKGSENGMTEQEIATKCTANGIGYSRAELKKLEAEGLVRNDKGVYKAQPSAWN